MKKLIAFLTCLGALIAAAAAVFFLFMKMSGEMEHLFDDVNRDGNEERGTFDS